MKEKTDIKVISIVQDIWEDFRSIDEDYESYEISREIDKKVINS